MCEPCRDREAAEAEAQAAAEAKERKSKAREARKAKIHQLLHEAGASPWEHGNATLRNFDTSESGPEPVEACMEFVRAVRDADAYDPVQGLYLSGTTGAGKTHLAVGICRALLLEPSIRPESIVFDPADVLASGIRALYGGRGDVDAYLRRRERARVWILDDLGREPPHPDVIGHLTMLISQRGLRGTVITGNTPPTEYERRHPELARIGSRLGPSYFRTVQVRGRDRRHDVQRSTTQEAR